jgi:hypothetical protein
VWQNHGFLELGIMKLLAKISVVGCKEALDVLSSNNAIRHGGLKQLGLKKRKDPPSNLWSYSSPFYKFDFSDTFDDELYSFIYANHDLKRFLHNTSSGIDNASLLIMIAEQTSEEMFGCFFSHKTIVLLSDTGLDLDIDPEVCIPDFPYWVDCR